MSESRIATRIAEFGVVEHGAVLEVVGENLWSACLRLPIADRMCRVRCVGNGHDAAYEGAFAKAAHLIAEAAAAAVAAVDSAT